MSSAKKPLIGSPAKSTSRGGLAPLALTTMQASSEPPVARAHVTRRLVGRPLQPPLSESRQNRRPCLQDVNVTVDLLPERRVVSIENAWISSNEARPGDDIPVKVFLRPYRGERIEREFTIKLPPGIAKGEHRILLSDADTLNRVQNLAGRQSLHRYSANRLSAQSGAQLMTAFMSRCWNPRPPLTMTTKPFPRCPCPC